MSIKKQYLKTKAICKVTFRLPKEAVNSAQKVNIVGDFNNWDNNATEMKRLKNNSYTVTLDLEKGHEYQYRYLIDGVKWENDWDADKYVTSQIADCENSVVVLEN